MALDSTTILETLRAHQSELQAMGVRRIALFGSQAQGVARPDSDVDIGVEFEDAVRRPALAYFAARQRLEDRLSTLLDAKVDLSDEEMQRPLVRENYQADRLYAF